MTGPDRTPEQVLAAARALDRARAAGLPDDLLVILLAARDAWWGLTPWPDPIDLATMIAHPAATLADAMTVTATRSHLRHNPHS